MPNNQLEIVLDEFLTSIDHDNQFYVNLLFKCSIYRPMCTHMGEELLLSMMTIRNVEAIARS